MYLLSSILCAEEKGSNRNHVERQKRNRSIQCPRGFMYDGKGGVEAGEV